MTPAISVHRPPSTVDSHEGSFRYGPDYTRTPHQTTSASSICPRWGRVRRIAGFEEQESFVGSDLSYEDIGGREIDESRIVRVFGVYNPAEESAFARVIANFNARDNVAVETSGGWFTGAGIDALSSLATRDFIYARLKVFF